MRALTRIRRLAAALTLLLFVTTTVFARVPGKPLERPEGPETSPTEVGEPDAGHNLTLQRILMLIAAAQANSPFFRRFALPMRTASMNRPSGPGRTTWGR